MVIQQSVCALGVMAAMSGVAAVASAQVPVPRAEGPIPVTADSYPMMAADRLIDPIDLEDYGYIEEEYFVSGMANAYDWSPANGLAAAGSGPYTTRILLRRPVTPAGFSGNVVVELPNTARRYDAGFVWSLSWEHLLMEGDAWVGITFLPDVVEALKEFDSARYAPLVFGTPSSATTCTPDGPSTDLEEALRWDMISQVGTLLKSGPPGGPLAGFGVEYVYAASHQTDLQTYVNVIHPVARLAGGRPIFDGYVLHRDRGPARLNRCATTAPPAVPADVPVIRIVAEGDVLSTLARRRDDSDDLRDRYRLYEVAGAPHADAYFYRNMPTPADQEAAGTDPFLRVWPFAYACEPEIALTEADSMRFVANAAFEHLDRWVRDGAAPPRAERIAVSNAATPEAELLRDSFGNAVGGVRTPDLEVPRATYSPKSGGPGACGNLLHTEPFGWARLESVYGSYREYADRLLGAVDRLQKEGWLVPADAESVRREIAGP